LRAPPRSPGHPSSPKSRLLIDFFESAHRQGLPDGIQIFKPKSHFGSILEDHVMEDVGIFYGHLVHFTAILCILWPFRIIQSHLVYFLLFWVCCTEKNLATLPIGAFIDWPNMES
jgi:hypothetical protein